MKIVRDGESRTICVYATINCQLSIDYCALCVVGLAFTIVFGN